MLQRILMFTTPVCFLFLSFLPFSWAEGEASKKDLKRVLALQKKLTSMIERTSRAYLSIEGGSGVIISPLGEVLTNEHVISNRKPGDTWYVMDPAGKIHQIRYVGVDKWGDLALLKLLSAPPHAFVPLASPRSIKVGDPVVALGNPFSLSTDGKPAASWGVISATRLNDYNYSLAIQTDAAINPGNSGGPLLNLKGELVGINGKISARYGSGINSGVGYAIPVEQIRRFLPHLRKGGEVHHGTISGIKLDLREDVPLIRLVDPQSAAGKAGFQKRDIIVAVDGVKVHSMSHYVGRIQSYPEGEKVKITLRRGKAKKTLHVKLDRFHPPKLARGQGKQKAYLGVRISPKGSKTYEVEEILPGSPANRAGLKKGDLILRVDGKKFSNKKKLGRHIQKKTPGYPLRLLIRRKGKEKTLIVVLGQR